MSTHYSPQIITDGLVFYYDMGNTQKSWKGAPTTNLLTYSKDFSNAVWTTSLPPSTITPNYATAPDGTNTATRLVYQTGTNPRVFQNISSTVGLAYTFSVWLKSADGSTQTIYLYLRETGFGTTYATTACTVTSEWQRFSVSVVIPAGSVSIYTLIYRGATTPLWDILAWGAQYEQGSFATELVNTTTSTASRTNTQAIVDLTGNNTVTASSLTYAADGAFSFNGSSNYISATGSGLTGSTTAYTIMFWARRDVENRMPVSSLTGTSFYWYGDNSWRYVHGGVGGEHYYSKPTSIPLGTWGHYCVTYNGATVTIYRQGVFQSSVASTGTADWSMGMQIGNWQGGSGYQWSGAISSVSMYNRALSATEVKQNFNALRGRYGI